MEDCGCEQESDSIPLCVTSQEQKEEKMKHKNFEAVPLFDLLKPKLSKNGGTESNPICY